MAQLNRLGKAELHVSLSNSKKTFLLEIYETHEYPNPDGSTTKTVASPNFAATRWIPQNFPTGHIQRTASFPKYEVPFSDETIRIIEEEWPKENKKVIAESAISKYQYFFYRAFAASENARRVAEFKERGKVPTNSFSNYADNLQAKKGISLRPFQKVAAFNACSTSSYGLFLDPGLGKTCIMIRKMDHVIHSFQKTETKDNPLILILCPKSIRGNWYEELERFSIYSEKLHIFFLQGKNDVDRFQNFFSEYAVAIHTNKVPVCVANFESFVGTSQIHNLQWDLCCLDESQNIADPSTKRTRAIIETRDNFLNRVIATGTPFRNSITDFFPQFEFMGEGVSGFGSLASFQKFFLQEQKGYNGRKPKLVDIKKIPFLKERIAKNAFVGTREEFIKNMPERMFAIRHCEMSPEQERVYYTLAEQFYAEIEGISENDSMTVNNILTKMLRLAQITSGFAQLDSGLVNSFDPNPKLDLLINELLGSSDGSEGVLSDPNQKAIVWTTFVQDIKTISARLSLENIKHVIYHGKMTQQEKDDAKDALNNDIECRLLVGTAQSGGVGLNLVGFDKTKPEQYKTNVTHTYFFSKNWSSEKRTQANDRAYRLITRVPQYIIDLLVPSSIDTIIHERVLGKIEAAKNLQDVKSILKQILAQRV